jgi:hypothetical protein
MARPLEANATMFTLRNASLHHNAIVIFDGGRIRQDAELRAARARFGHGILSYVPHTGRCAFTHQDELAHAAMLAEEAAKPTSSPTMTPGDLMNRIKADLAKCKRMRRRYDALLVTLHGVKPIRGGSPASDYEGRLDAIMNGIDVETSHVTDVDVARVVAIG